MVAQSWLDIISQGAYFMQIHSFPTEKFGLADFIFPFQKNLNEII